MPVCMSICVAGPTVANGTPHQSLQSSPCQKLAAGAGNVVRRKPTLQDDDNLDCDNAELNAVQASGIVSSSSTDIAGCCAIGSRVRLRPDAVYVQLGDVDAPGARCVRIVHIGDAFGGKRRCSTAELASRIPDGDVLVHSGGDFSFLGGLNSGGAGRSISNRLGSLLAPLLRHRELSKLRDLLSALPHRHKILVPACDGVAQKELQRLLGSTCHCLRDSTVILEGVSFYGLSSPMSADSLAAGKEDDLETIDVLVSHSPPQDQELAREVLQRIRPKALLHGHSATSDNDNAVWHDGVLLSNGRLRNNKRYKVSTPATEATAATARETGRDLSKPVVIDFYTCRPVSGSQEYSEVLQTVGSKVSRSVAKRSDYSECNVL